MGSESSEPDSGILDNATALEPCSPGNVPFQGSVADSSLAGKARKPRSAAALDPKREKASEIVRQCVEEGDEVVDLSRLDLQELAWTLLEPIEHITRQPSADMTYASLEPRIRLYLARNSLSELPAEVYGIENLTTLSLRQNNVAVLPESISRLINLEDLNLGSNDLHFLPWEILKLTEHALNTLWLHPNPLFEPIKNGASLAGGPLMKDLLGGKKCKAISRVTYLDIRGRPLPLQGNPPSTSLQATPSLPVNTTPITQEQHESASRVPSLYELAIRAFSLYPRTDQLVDSLLLYLPAHMETPLKRVSEFKATGGSNCSVCGRPYIVPRTEWLEWWTGLPCNETFGIPLLRRGCSWECLPDAAGGLPPEVTDCGWRPMTEE